MYHMYIKTQAPLLRLLTYVDNMFLYAEVLSRVVLPPQHTRTTETLNGAHQGTYLGHRL